MTEEAAPAFEPEGVPAPEVDADVSQPEVETEVEATPEGNEADSSPAAEEASEEDGRRETEAIQRRIDELTRLRRSAERDRDHWREMAVQNRQTTPQPEQPAPPPRTLADFNYDENKYREYLFQEARTEAVRAARSEAQTWQREQESIARRAQFDARAESFAKTTTDFHSVFDEHVPVSEAMAEAMMDADEGPAIAYYLGKNLDVATRLASLSPVMAGREIAKIEDRIVAERQKVSRPSPSKAPPPAPKIEGANAAGSVSPSTAAGDKLSDREWLARREKQLAKQRG